MAVGCPFITCAVKRKELEFCTECPENKHCKKWSDHREYSKQHDTFKCYQKLEDNIKYITEHGIEEFVREQKAREKLLKRMLDEFNDGRSKNFYCIAATVLDIPEMEDALAAAEKQATGLDIKGRASVLHTILDNIASEKEYCLKLRK
jgi:hypothetical protein